MPSCGSQNACACADCTNRPHPSRLDMSSRGLPYQLHDPSALAFDWALRVLKPSRSGWFWARALIVSAVRSRVGGDPTDHTLSVTAGHRLLDRLAGGARLPGNQDEVTRRAEVAAILPTGGPGPMNGPPPPVIRPPSPGAPSVVVRSEPPAAGSGELAYEWQLIYCGLEPGTWMRSVVKVQQAGREMLAGRRPGQWTWEDVVIDEVFKADKHGCTPLEGNELDETPDENKGPQDKAGQKRPFDVHGSELHLRSRKHPSLDCPLCKFHEFRFVKFGPAELEWKGVKPIPPEVVYIELKFKSDGEGCLYKLEDRKSKHRAKWKGPYGTWDTVVHWAVPCEGPPPPVGPPPSSPSVEPSTALEFTSRGLSLPGGKVPEGPWRPAGPAGKGFVPP